MRATYRSHGGGHEYWTQRWTKAAVDLGGLNLNKYPGKYAQQVADATKGPLLEAGCGLGRNVIHYHRQGREITGIDYVQEAIDKIKEGFPGLDVRQADIMDLPFADETFEGVMAFGLYHNLEHGIDAALRETFRVMAPGGILVASARLDNIQNRINDWIEAKKLDGNAERKFHKANYTEREFRAILVAAGFTPEKVEYVENMPLLYKFRFFRNATHKNFDESLGRSEGYKLSWLGSALQNALFRLFPRSFCNIIVAFARRPISTP